VGKAHVSLPYSKLRHAIANKLHTSGYVAAVASEGKNVVEKKLVITLQYSAANRPRINGVKRVSKPGRRLYVKVSDIYPVKFGTGNLFLSTPAGILTDEEARALPTESRSMELLR
jgi:small subunit ribosomal protein S8